MSAIILSKILDVLIEIHDKMPSKPGAPVVNVPVLKVPVREETPARPALKPAPAVQGGTLADAKRQALQAVLEVLDGWIDGQRSNHEALEHRGEPLGGECWRSFSPADIRTMIDDAAREVGLPPLPAPDAPAEDA